MNKFANKVNNYIVSANFYSLEDLITINYGVF